VSWPEAAGLTEAELEARLFPTEHLPSLVHRPPPDSEYIYKQLRRYRNVNLTLTQLWLEYKERHPDGYPYTQFCEHYRRWRGSLTTACARSTGPARRCLSTTPMAWLSSTRRPASCFPPSCL
jgi:transposase